jgi:glycosyltransferase involved in cell wall biosynthesis
MNFMQRVLMVSFHFPPTGGPGVQRITKLVKYLPQHGWNACVLAIDPDHANDYPQDKSLLSEIPTDTIVERMIMKGGAGRLLFDLSIWMKRRRWGRGILRGLLVPDAHALWRQIAVQRGLRMIEDHQIEAIYTTEPISAHWVGYLLQQRTGLPWIMDIRDLWTQSFTYQPISYLHGRFDSWLERRLIRSATAVSCVTKGFKQELSALHSKDDPRKFVVIQNGYDEDDFAHVVPATGKNQKFTLAYVGSLYDFAVRPRPTGWKRFLEPIIQGDGPAEMMRTPRFLLQAVRELLSERPDLQDRVRIQFVGLIPPASKEIIGELGLDEVVESTGYVPHHNAIETMVNADVLVLMQAGKGSEVVVPGKLYEYLRTGRAILGLFPEGESPEIIRATRSGIVVAPDDITAIRQQIAIWLAMWEQDEPLSQPDWATIRTYSREEKTADFAMLLNRVTNLQKRR